MVGSSSLQMRTNMINNTKHFFVSVSVLIRKNKMCPLKSTCYCEKIPDAQNCHVFREMKHQVRDFFIY